MNPQQNQANQDNQFKNNQQNNPEILKKNASHSAEEPAEGAEEQAPEDLDSNFAEQGFGVPRQ